MPRGSGEPDASGLDEIIRRIVEVAEPDEIVLFGSAARGEMGPDSDVDLLVVKSGVQHRGRLADAIYLRLLGVDLAVDVVVVTPGEWLNRASSNLSRAVAGAQMPDVYW